MAFNIGLVASLGFIRNSFQGLFLSIRFRISIPGTDPHFLKINYMLDISHRVSKTLSSIWNSLGLVIDLAFGLY